MVLATTTTKYVTPRPADIMAGRSHRAFRHTGNVMLRIRIVENLDQYKKCTRRKQKSSIIRGIIDEISAEGGRFLRRGNETKQWYDAGFKAAHVKISHSFRDAAITNKIKCLSPLKASMKRRTNSWPTQHDKELSMAHPDASIVHSDDWSSKISDILTEESSENACIKNFTSAIAEEEHLPDQPDEQKSSSLMEPVKSALLIPRGEIFLNPDQACSILRQESDQISLHNHLACSKRLYGPIHEIVSGKADSLVGAQLAKDESETEDLSQIAVLDLSLADFLDDTMLDHNFDMEEFSW